MKLTLYDQTIARLDERLFGHFLERAGESEPGPEAAIDPTTGELHRAVAAQLAALRLPLLRFPGGFDVEYGARWTTLIDHAPGRDGSPRPPGCRFGLHEFFDLCQALRSEPLIVVSACSHVMPQQALSLERSLELAAAEVAYCNLPLDAPSTPELLSWAQLRARNGHPEPFGVRLWQVGNEPFLAYVHSLRQQGAADDEIGRGYVEVVEKHIRAMRAVDGSLQFIVEVQMEDITPPVPVLDELLRRLGDEIAYLSYHIYQPWGVETLERGGRPLAPAELTPAELWRCLVSTPGSDPLTGQSAWAADSMERFRASGKPLAITEWNVNMWWANAEKGPPWRGPYSDFANGLGVAGFLHAFLREAGLIRLGAQSMLVGSQWLVGGLDVRGLARGLPPRLRASLAVTSLYAQHHGRAILRSQVSDAALYAQPIRMQNIRPAAGVAWLDALATRDERSLYLHVINRDPAASRTLDVDLSRLPADPQGIIVHRLAGQPDPSHATDPVPAWVEQHEPVGAAAHSPRPGALQLQIPAASVNVYVIPMTTKGT